MIDKEKLIAWLDKQTDAEFEGEINAQDAFQITKWAIEEGKFERKDDNQ